MYIKDLLDAVCNILNFLSGDGRADTLERSSSFSRADTLERSSSFSRADTLERTSSVSEEYLRAIGNPQHIEKRFPVDRKKLERLIVGKLKG